MSMSCVLFQLQTTPKYNGLTHTKNNYLAHTPASWALSFEKAHTYPHRLSEMVQPRVIGSASEMARTLGWQVDIDCQLEAQPELKKWGS